MNIFGVSIDLDYNMLQSNHLQERLVAQTLKKAGERRAFASFLNGSDLEGQRIYDCLLQKSANINGSSAVTPQLIKDFVVSELKATKFAQLSIYESIVRSVVESLDPSLRASHAVLDKNRSLAEISPKYPSIRNKAECLVKAKLAEDDPRLVEVFLKRKSLESQLREMSQVLFFGINKLHLDGENLVRFLHIMFDLKMITEAGTERLHVLMNMVGEAIKNKTPLKLINLKCLRMTYPLGKNLRLLTSMENAVVINKDHGEFRPPSEEQYFEKLNRVNKIFTRQGISTSQFSLVVDTDLIDHFSHGGSGLIPDVDIIKAQNDIPIYVDNMQKVAGERCKVTTLTQYLDNERLAERFHQIRDEVLVDLESRTHKLIDAKIAEDRVDYRFTSNERIFGKKNREHARFSAFNQMASLFGLQVLAGKNVILVVEERGIENKLMGGRNNKDLPIIFVGLTQ